MSEWTPVEESLPMDGVECEVLFQDGDSCYGLYLGNDPVAPLDGWMIDVTDEYPKQTERGRIVKWRRLP